MSAPQPKPGTRISAADAALDAVLTDISGLHATDVSTHVEVFERAHAALQQRLEADS